MIDLWIAPELEFWPNFGTRTWYERSFGPFSGVNLWDEETEKEEQHLSCRQGSQTRFPTGTIKEITQHLSVTRHETPVFPAISVIYSEQFQSSSLWVDFPVGWFFWGALMILDAYLSIIHVCILSLVGGLEHFCFHIYWELHHPNWRVVHHFSEGWLNHQPVLHGAMPPDMAMWRWRWMGRFGGVPWDTHGFIRNPYFFWGHMLKPKDYGWYGLYVIQLLDYMDDIKCMESYKTI